MASKVITSHRIHFRKQPDPTVVLLVSPGIISAPDGKVSRDTGDVYLDIYENGVLKTPDAIVCPEGFDISGLKGQAGTEFENLKFQFLKSNTPGTNGRCGYRFYGTVEHTVTLSLAVEYGGTKYSGQVQIAYIPSGPPGGKGEPGAPTPPPMMWDDYPSTYEFQDGKTAVNGSPASRLDCVLMHNTAKDTKDKFPLCYYRCLKSHVKAADKKPGAETASGGPYWEQASVFSTIASQVILGQNGYIQLLSTQSLKVYKADGVTVNAAFGGGDWPAWFGATTPANAPTKINADGTIYSKKAVIEGDIHATSGIFEGSVLQKFKFLENSDAVEQGSGSDLKYLLKSDLNIISHQGDHILLPTSKEYIGYRVAIANNIEKYTRTDYSTLVSCQDGSPLLGFPKSDSSTSLPTSGDYARLSVRYLTGIAEFIALPNTTGDKCRWCITSLNAFWVDPLS